MTSHNIHLTMFFSLLISTRWQVSVYGGNSDVFTKKACRLSMRTASRWELSDLDILPPGSLTAFVWQRADTEEMWDAGTDVFFDDRFCVIFYVCLVCVQFMLTIGMCTLLQGGQFKAWLLLLYHTVTLNKKSPCVLSQEGITCSTVEASCSCKYMLLLLYFMLRGGYFLVHQVCVCIHVGGPWSTWENMDKINIWRWVMCELLGNPNVAR